MSWDGSSILQVKERRRSKMRTDIGGDIQKMN